MKWIARERPKIDRHELDPAAPGLLAITLGLSHNFQNDHEMLKHGMAIYDALYSWCQSHQEERHLGNLGECSTNRRSDPSLINKEKTMSQKLALIFALLIVAVPVAFAGHNKKAIKKSETAMMNACKKEYPDAVKRKKFKEVAEW